MEERYGREICLLNDSFPPFIDGVANAVENYATILNRGKYRALVVTPDCPGADDGRFDFPVVRYPSMDLRKQIGYTAGNPFVPRTLLTLGKRDIALLHSHCPLASNLLARGLREELKVPLVMTYHTKFDIDIENIIRGKLLQREAIKALIESVGSVDELWVVSKGAGESIRKLGYEGDYIVMSNGVDMPKQRASDAEVREATAGYDLPRDVPLFLFVGRLMWYKGIRLIADALRALRSQQIDFRMVFIGGGGDEEEIKAYISELGLAGCCFFTGPVYERKRIAAWYTRADLFLFPSTFDTNGLVVREAAACSLATVMIGGSCVAEGVTDGVNGLFVEENAASLAVCLARVGGNRELLRRIGDNAAADLYLSWEEAVGRASDRYDTVIENYRLGKYTRRHDLADEFFVLRNEFLEVYETIDNQRKKIEDLIEERLERDL